MMFEKYRALVITAVFCLVIGSFGCKKNDTEEHLDDAADHAADVVEDAGDAVEQAGDAVEDATE